MSDLQNKKHHLIAHILDYQLGTVYQPGNGCRQSLEASLSKLSYKALQNLSVLILASEATMARAAISRLEGAK
jgi:hypothetical protein